MFFFLIHNIIHYLIRWSPETSEGRKNTFTIFLGSIFHVLLYVTLEWHGIVGRNLFLSILKNWYIWILVGDLLTMLAIYKLYWGRNIIAETSDPDEWTLDSKHQYHRKMKPPQIIKLKMTELSDPPLFPPSGGNKGPEELKSPNDDFFLQNKVLDVPDSKAKPVSVSETREAEVASQPVKELVKPDCQVTNDESVNVADPVANEITSGPLVDTNINDVADGEPVINRGESEAGLKEEGNFLPKHS